LLTDFRPWDQDFLTDAVSCYNVNFIYHDFEKKMLYIGFSEWENSEGEMHCPEDKEFQSYVNETNTCKINVNNFIEFTEKWVELKLQLPPFAIIYRDNNDWIFCIGFDSTEEMKVFVDDNTQTVH